MINILISPYPMKRLIRKDIALGPEIEGVPQDIYTTEWKIGWSNNTLRLYRVESGNNLIEVQPIAPFPQFIYSNISNVSLSFDELARVVVSWEQDSAVYIRQFSAEDGGYVNRGGFPGIAPILMSNKQMDKDADKDDILVVYLWSNSTAVLAYRRKSEQYVNEYIITSYMYYDSINSVVVNRYSYILDLGNSIYESDPRVFFTQKIDVGLFHPEEADYNYQGDYEFETLDDSIEASAIAPEDTSETIMEGTFELDLSSNDSVPHSVIAPEDDSDYTIEGNYELDLLSNDSVPHSIIAPEDTSETIMEGTFELDLNDTAFASAIAPEDGSGFVFEGNYELELPPVDVIASAVIPEIGSDYVYEGLVTYTTAPEKLVMNTIVPAVATYTYIENVGYSSTSEYATIKPVLPLAGSEYSYIVDFSSYNGGYDKTSVLTELPESGSSYFNLGQTDKIHSAINVMTAKPIAPVSGSTYSIVTVMSYLYSNKQYDKVDMASVANPEEGSVYLSGVQSSSDTNKIEMGLLAPSSGSSYYI